VISNYLDIYKLQNQLKVYEQNKRLAQIRLENLTKMREEQMITRNELIRAELLIKNIEQAILTLNNNLAILSNQMSYALGLPQNILIVPTEQIDNKIVDSLDKYVEMAHLQHQSLATATTNINLAKKGIGISKAEYYPTIAAFAGYNMQRPMTSVQPAVDLYANTWQSGISLSFNIDNLYKTKQKIRLGEQQEKIAEEAFVLIEQNVNIGVYAAYTKYQEALKQSEIMTEAKKLATENYNIVEAKYLNQLAITAEMTDASNAKLEAELQHINSTITVLFQYYNLIKSTGTL
jgi:outer membrane protein TolC